MDTSIKKYSPIAPIALLEQLEVFNLLGDYLLLLAHDVLDHRKRYDELVGHTTQDDCFIILDNSTIELGHPLGALDLMEAADHVKPNCIILPDVMRDKDATIAASNKAMEEFAAHGSTPDFMKIVQGSTGDEFLECRDWMYTHIPGHYWAVPRWVANTWHSRRFLTERIIEVDPDAMIHMLGMSNNINDDIACTKMDNVMGIDSANPLVMGQKGIVLDPNDYIHHPRDDFWEHTELHDQTLQNIRFMREILS